MADISALNVGKYLNDNSPISYWKELLNRYCKKHTEAAIAIRNFETSDSFNIEEKKSKYLELAEGIFVDNLLVTRYETLDDENLDSYDEISYCFSRDVLSYKIKMIGSNLISFQLLLKHFMLHEDTNIFLTLGLSKESVTYMDPYNAEQLLYEQDLRKCEIVREKNKDFQDKVICAPIPRNEAIKRTIGALHDNNIHYGCLEICHDLKIVLVYDGLVEQIDYWVDAKGNSKNTWKQGIINALSLCYENCKEIGFNLEYIVFDTIQRRTRGHSGSVLENMLKSELMPHIRHRGECDKWLVVNSNYWNLILEMYRNGENVEFTSDFNDLVPNWMKRQRIHVRQSDNNSCGFVAAKILYHLSTIDLDKNEVDDRKCDMVNDIKVGNVESCVNVRAEYICRYMHMLMSIKERNES
jgi:hypothetical protein